MNNKIAHKFAIKNLRAHRLVYLPFILSSGIMLMVFNIMASLSANTYVRERHASLPMIINIGIVIIGILTFIFFIYSTNFLNKRRNKEFALYGILGLEKRHIRKIIFLELLIAFVIIGVIGLIGGYIFGKLSFLALNKLMKDVAGGLMDYPFSIKAMVETIMLIALAFLTSLFATSLKIYNSTPVELLSDQKSGEGEPKSRYILMVLGFVLLIAGYYIAIRTQGILKSLGYFFLASLIVMLATYILFMSFSVVYLKRQKEKKSYYKKERFLAISGLLYRIKSNAISLASISIMSVGVIIALAASLSIYDRIEYSARNVVPREYNLDSPVAIDENNIEEEKEKLRNIVQGTTAKGGKITNDFISYGLFTSIQVEGDKFQTFMGDGKHKPYFLLACDLDGYNKRVGKDYKLADDEILLTANQKFMLDKDIIEIADRIYKVKTIDNFIPSNVAIETYGIVVKDFETIKFLSSQLKLFDRETSSYEDSIISLSANWDVTGIDKITYRKNLEEYSKDKDINIENADKYLEDAYELYGGFVFLGTIIAIIFLISTILISYYKQISEGFEDRKKYEIMKKIGLEDKLIKKTSASQISYLFGAPLAFAIINSLVASKIVYQLLALFGVMTFMQYGRYFFIMIGVFVLIYYIIFRITNRAYYRVVSR
ncbi:MAG: FtsX-like permease family protein [Anaerococcus prevotii]|uniref:FtsX-like permease family protein n=1 Tax=Anaerococcus prevotii TaxID=33034 RepID=UPI00290450CB|nr:FtsX-like permease family protein [Anaerococcus prevotii]MDU2558252.1 FtsX-like permease family protein [Anaerococcus prevotii]